MEDLAAAVTAETQRIRAALTGWDAGLGRVLDALERGDARELLRHIDRMVMLTAEPHTAQSQLLLWLLDLLPPNA